MGLRDLISGKLNEIERGLVCPAPELRNYVMSGEEVCDNIRWSEPRAVLHPTGISNIYHIIDNPCVRAEIRQWIANKLGINIEYICPNIQIPVGDFHKWQGTGHFRRGNIRNSPAEYLKPSIFQRTGLRWDIYNIGYFYKQPAPGIPEYLWDEISAILGIIPQVTTYQNRKIRYAAEVKSVEQEIAELNEKLYDLRQQETRLQSQVNGFQIGNTISSLNAKQKAHILLKLWYKGDEGSVSVKNAIKQYGFDPHYACVSGQSLQHLALSCTELFELLIKNGIDFNATGNANVSLFHLVMNTGNNKFIRRMFATGKDFSKSVLDVVLKNDALMLAKLFNHKSNLSEISYSGYSLLQLALKQGCYEAAELILQSNRMAIDQLAVGGLSALQLALLTDNKLGVDLLKKYGANFELGLKNAITKNYLNVVNKILIASPELLNKIDTRAESPLYHALLQRKLPIAEHLLNKGADPKSVLLKGLGENKIQMIKDLVALIPDSANLTIDGDKTALYLALEQNRTEVAEALSKSSDLMAVVRLSSEKSRADIVVQLLKLEPSVLTLLADEDNCKLTGELLEDAVFTSLVNSATDNNDNNLLHLACKSNNYELAIRILERSQIDVNEQNNESKTAFHILLESAIGFKEKAQLAEMILKLDPDIHLPDVNGHTAIDLALEHDAEVLAMFYREELIVDSSHADL